MNFNEKLQSLINDNDVSIKELAEKVNTDCHTIDKWLSNTSTPSIEQLKKISEYFNISVDELLGNNKRHGYHYEYKSKKMIGNLPLVHVNIGHGIKNLKPAKGVIAIGNIACGVLSIGGIATGIFALGGLALGLISVAGLALGLLLSVAGISIGFVSVGGIAIGVLSIGGIAIGVYSIGGIAIARNIALGGSANAHIAIGKYTKGFIQFNPGTRFESTLVGEIKASILTNYPNTPGIIVDLFTKF